MVGGSAAPGRGDHAAEMVNIKDISRTTRAGLLMMAMLPAVAHSAERTLWKIGNFDASSGEFRSQGIDYTDPKSDPVFVVGKSGNQDWYRFQPGPANGMTGARLHPFTIRFSLTSAPRGVYRLKIAMLYETPRLSFLMLKANGHSGYFYFHPRLDFHAGDWEGTFVPQTSTDEKTIDIPGDWLRKGENEFVLTAMDDPAISPDFARRNRARPHRHRLRRARIYSRRGSAISPQRVLGSN